MSSLHEFEVVNNLSHDLHLVHISASKRGIHDVRLLALEVWILYKQLLPLTPKSQKVQQNLGLNLPFFPNLITPLVGDTFKNTWSPGYLHILSTLSCLESFPH